MYIELTLKHLDVKSLFLVNNIACMYPFENGTRIHLIGDDLPFDCIEKYDEIKRLILSEAQR